MEIFGFTLDKNGFIQNKTVLGDSGNLSLGDSIIEATCPPKSLVRPRWLNGEWVEGASKKEVLAFKASKIKSMKSMLIIETKSKASLAITKIAPTHTQINWTLDKKLDDKDVLEKISRINLIRSKCNEYLDFIEKAKTIADLESLKIKY